MIRAITFDFGNTLVPVPDGALRGVVGETARAIATRLGPFDEDEVNRVWSEERARQFREEVPHGREVDLGQRLGRILARLRGMPAPPDEVPWDDTAAGLLSDAAERDWAVDVYSGAFVDRLPPAPQAGSVLAALAPRYPLAVLSNWPLATTIDRYVDAAGWSPYLRAVVVSQRVGTIKPHPAIFAAAREALGQPDPGDILHVGDDWVADVVGAKRAGWLAAYLGPPSDSPLPGSDRDATVVADLSWTTRRAGGGPRTPRLRRPLTATRADPGSVGRLAPRGGTRPDRQPGVAGRVGHRLIVVGLIVTGRDPYADPMAGYTGAIAIGVAVGLLAIPLCWLVVFARHRRIAYQGDWARAARRGAWVGLFAAALVILRLVDAFQLPILLFLAAIFIVAEVALSSER